MRGPLLERMPAFERSRLRVSQDAVAATATTAALANGVHTDTQPTQHHNNNNNESSNALLDLLGGIGETSDTTSSNSATATITTTKAGAPLSSGPNTTLNADILDLLGGIDAGGGGGMAPTTVNNGVIPTPAGNATTNNILDGLLNNDNYCTSTLANNAINSTSSIGNSTPISILPLQTTEYEKVTAYERNGLKLVMSFERQDFMCTITLEATNTSPTATITDFLFQAAVPKSLQLQLLTPSTTTVPPTASLTQLIRVNNPNKVRRVSYT